MISLDFYKNWSRYMKVCNQFLRLHPGIRMISSYCQINSRVPWVGINHHWAIVELNLNDYVLCLEINFKKFLNTNPYFFRLFMLLLQLNNVADEFTKTPINITLIYNWMGICQNDKNVCISINKYSFLYRKYHVHHNFYQHFLLNNYRNITC